MLIRVKNMLTGKVNEMDLPVTEQQFSDWQNGVLIQNAMPNLSVGEREFLITGMSLEEQKEIFG